MRRRAAAVAGVALACVLAAGVVGLGYTWLKGSGMFTLHSVAVRGGTESDREAARDAVARAAAGRSLLALSSSQVAAAIEQVPTIRLASVDRDFPHTLRIRIVPERAVALAVEHGALPQPRGRERARAARLRPGRGAAVAAAHLAAAPASARFRAARCTRRRIQAALEALSARPAGFRAQIANVKVEPERGIVMRLRGGLDIVARPAAAARSEDARGRVGAAGTTDARRARAALYADVSAPNRPAVMPRGGYTETAGLGQETKKSDTGSKTAENGA